jgi:hypothetical protein
MENGEWRIINDLQCVNNITYSKDCVTLATRNNLTFAQWNTDWTDWTDLKGFFG